jgi:hypothetical protein
MTLKPPEHLNTGDNALIKVSITNPATARLMIGVFEEMERMGIAEIHSADRGGTGGDLASQP